MTEVIKNSINLYEGDCLEKLKLIPDNSIDLVLTDPPYGTTANKWDTVIDLPLMWDELKRVTKDNGAIVLFCSQPFTSNLISSNYKMFKYTWVWQKSRFANQMLAKKQPLKIHEDIAVFYNKQCLYSPQGLIEVNKVTKQGARVTDNNGGGTRPTSYIQTHTNYPRTIQAFSSASKTVHPTQKPVDLLEYLIKTYTNKNETVLDFTIGSGSTCIAAMNTKRNCIGIELDSNYFNVSSKRIEDHNETLDNKYIITKHDKE